MIKLSKGDFSISMKTNQKDEISQVSNEFDNAIKQLRQLRESRNLFLRNIMHELKTPITKGKLITDMYDDCERKFILIRVFQRLEYLLSEFAKIEELTSGKINLKKGDFIANRFIDEYLFGIDHPYGKYSSETAYNQLTRDDLTTFYNKYYKEGECTVFMAGKFPSNIESILNQYIGTLPLNKNVIEKLGLRK